MNPHSQPLPPRSWLFVPGDSERKQAKALATAADALILDLEDSVDPSRLPQARSLVAGVLATAAGRIGPQLWVRCNSPASGLMSQDLETACATAMPQGVMLPKISAPEEVIAAAGLLAQMEVSRGMRVGGTQLLVLATETALGLLGLPQYPAVLGGSAATRARLVGLTWGSEDLSVALGALAKHDAQGALTFAFQMARTGCLVTAAALGVAAIDGVRADFKDPAGLARELAEARRDGFTGKLAIHPDQVTAINAAFTPTAEECAHASRVIAAFESLPGAGVASLDGQMIDRPHLLQAQRVLARAGARSAGR